jgi:hypothetical protein
MAIQIFRKSMFVPKITPWDEKNITAPKIATAPGDDVTFFDRFFMPRCNG